MLLAVWNDGDELTALCVVSDHPVVCPWLNASKLRPISWLFCCILFWLNSHVIQSRKVEENLRVTVEADACFTMKEVAVVWVPSLVFLLTKTNKNLNTISVPFCAGKKYEILNNC
jgi:hypothetical protein